jgi:rhodanese-related sulfurtransferase
VGVAGLNTLHYLDAVLIRLATLLILPAVLAAGTLFWHPGAPSFAEKPVPKQTYQQVIDSGQAIFWIDARSQAAYDQGHIENAVLLNEDHWNRLFPGFLKRWNPDQMIVVYCSDSGCTRSQEVAARLRKELGGNLKISVLKGGYEGWLLR